MQFTPKRYINIFKILNFLFAFVFLFSSIPVNSKVYFLEADYYQDKAKQEKIVLGKAEIISSDKAVIRVALSDPSIADIQVLSEKQIFIRGKHLGNCTLLVWEKDKSSPARFDLSVWPDITHLEKRLKEIDKNIMVEYIPPTAGVNSATLQQNNMTAATPSAADILGGEDGGGGFGETNVEATSGTSETIGKVILTGYVSNAESIAKALQIAGIYVGDDGIKIISQPGGLLLDGGMGNINLVSLTDGATAVNGTLTQFGGRDTVSFLTNGNANLSRGIIASTTNGQVISFLRVKDPPQISVAIRFYEVTRSLLRGIGVNSTLGGSSLQGASLVGGSAISAVAGGVNSAKDNNVVVMNGGNIIQQIGQSATGVIFSPDNGVGAVIQALQERGEVKLLAEPTLVISSAEPASFLAGGEVPILRSVILAGGASQNITYEPFGIRLSILPIITSENKIHLNLIPEIREIDNELSNFVSPPGSTSIRPPAFKTRRTQTQVDLESGQAFAISGLLREDTSKNLRKIPGVGDVPILGALFRSKSFRKGETELLIVVVPQIVKPNNPENIPSLTKEDSIPYQEFNELPTLKKPFVQLDDEKGPNIKRPINSSSHNSLGENPPVTEVELPEVETPKPKVELPEPELPKTDIESPELKQPKQKTEAEKLDVKKPAETKKPQVKQQVKESTKAEVNKAPLMVAKPVDESKSKQKGKESEAVKESKTVDVEQKAKVVEKTKKETMVENTKTEAKVENAKKEETMADNTKTETKVEKAKEQAVEQATAKQQQEPAKQESMAEQPPSQDLGSVITGTIQKMFGSSAPATPKVKAPKKKKIAKQKTVKQKEDGKDKKEEPPTPTAGKENKNESMIQVDDKEKPKKKVSNTDIETKKKSFLARFKKNKKHELITQSTSDLNLIEPNLSEDDFPVIMFRKSKSEAVVVKEDKTPLKGRRFVATRSNLQEQAPEFSLERNKPKRNWFSLLKKDQTKIASDKLAVPIPENDIKSEKNPSRVEKIDSNVVREVFSPKQINNQESILESVKIDNKVELQFEEFSGKDFSVSKDPELDFGKDGFTTVPILFKRNEGSRQTANEIDEKFIKILDSDFDNNKEPLTVPESFNQDLLKSQSESNNSSTVALLPGELIFKSKKKSTNNRKNKKKQLVKDKAEVSTEVKEEEPDFSWIDFQQSKN